MDYTEYPYRKYIVQRDKLLYIDANLHLEATERNIFI
jgi:hypothetical protein